MYHSPEDFIQAITKMAQAPETNEDDSLKGQQSDDVPELLQPDEGPGTGPRGEHESMSTGAEASHSENREGGYLQSAFNQFEPAARQAGAELSNALDNFGPDAIVSRATPEAGQSKIGSVQLRSFLDEVTKIEAAKK